ncbi:MAG: ABC transporter permease [Bryobacteraceae bacterium]
MAVYKRGYRRYDGPRVASQWRRLMVLPRQAWRRLFEQRLVLVVFIVGMFWPLLCAAYLYVSHHAELWGGLNASIFEALKVDGRFFRLFANTQCTFAVILAALAGPGMVAPDLTNGALPLYFSRPISRTGYVAARLATVFGMLSLITVVPGLLLFAMQAGMAPSEWISENWTFGLALAAGFTLWNLVVSLVALACSAWVRWRIVAGGLVLAFFFVTAGASTMINTVFRDNWGSLISPARQMFGLWCAMLGVDPPDGYDTPSALIALGLLIAGLLFVLERKLRPVEVVS